MITQLQLASKFLRPFSIYIPELSEEIKEQYGVVMAVSKEDAAVRFAQEHSEVELTPQEVAEHTVEIK